jgi:restriction system protein
MARRGGLLQAAARAQRDAQRRQLAEQRARAHLEKEAQRAQLAYERAKAQRQAATLREQKAQERERGRLYIESRLAETEAKTGRIAAQLEDLRTILQSALASEAFDLRQLKRDVTLPKFEPNGLDTPSRAPTLEQFLPKPPGLLSRMFGGYAAYERDVMEAHARFEKATAAHGKNEAMRRKKLEDAQAAHQQQCAQITARAADENKEVDALAKRLKAREPEAVATYFSLALDAAVLPRDLPQNHKLAYITESNQLVVEIELPRLDAVPDVEAYKYVKTKDEIAPVARSVSQRKTLYSSIVAQVTLSLEPCTKFFRPIATGA